MTIVQLHAAAVRFVQIETRRSELAKLAAAKITNVNRHQLGQRCSLASARVVGVRACSS